jgi:uncharacterized protein YjbI with pentapeptide repeats
MADGKHVEILLKGVQGWQEWRETNPGIRPNLTHADLRCALLDGADLQGADLTGADLTHAFLHEANLCQADLSSATLVGTNFCRARLCGARLIGADLHRANFDRADLSGAHLAGTNLERAVLVQTVVEGTDFEGARIYGASVWDLKGSPKNETDLIVTPPGHPTVTVSDLEVAQFIYLLLNNAKIRTVIDTVTAKAVLILGRFSDERKQILTAIRDRLSAEDYVPIIFDFDKPTTRDLTETVSTLAHLARFIIADITDPKSIPQELMRIIPQLPSVPVQPILLAGKEEWAMFSDLKRTGQVLATFHYQDLDDVGRSFKERMLAPALYWLEEFSVLRDPLQEIARLREEIRQLKTGGE